MSDAIVSLGKTGQQISEAFAKVNLLHERTRAENQRDIALQDVLTQAEKDTDTSKERLSYYKDQVGKVISESSKHITTPLEKDIFAQESLGKGNIANVNIHNTFNKKNIDLAKVELDKSMEIKGDEWIKSGSPKDKERIILERNLKIKQAMEAGFLDQASAQKMVYDMDKDWAKAQVEYDISIDPFTAKELLEGSAYQGISEDKRIELLKQANTAINARTIELEDNVMNKILADEMSIEELKSLSIPKDKGGLGSVKANIYIEKMESKMKQDITAVEKQKPKSKKYIKLIDQMVDNNVDNFNLKQEVVGAYLDGVIDTNENKMLLSMKKNLQDMRWNRKTDWFTNSVNAVKSWFGQNNPGDDALASSLKTLIQTTPDINNETQESMEEKTLGIIRDEQGKINPNRNLYEVGQVISTPAGSFKVVGYDGDGEPLVERVK